MPSINLAGVRTGFDLIPDGIYQAKLVGYKNGTAKSGNSIVTMEFDFIDDDEETKGRKAWVNFTLTDTSFFAIKRAFIDLGVDPDSLEGNVDTDEVLDGLVADGTEAWIKVGRHEYQGREHQDYTVVPAPVPDREPWG